LLHVGICCNCLARQGLLKGSKKVDITGYEIVTIKKAVQDVPMAAQEPVTSLVGRVRPILLCIDAF
jgi:hypothetical protein